MKQIPTKFYHNRLSNIGDFFYCLFVFDDLHRKHGLTFDLRISNAFKRNIGFCDLFAYQPCINSCDLVENETDLTSFVEFDMINKSYEDFYAQHFVNYFRETLNIDCQYNTDFIIKVPPLTKEKDIDFFTNKKIVGDRTKALDHRRKHRVIASKGLCQGDEYYFLPGNFPFLVDCAIIQQSSHPFITTITGIATIANLMNKEMIIYYDDELSQWPKNTTGEERTFDDLLKRMYLLDRNVKGIKI